MGDVEPPAAVPGPPVGAEAAASDVRRRRFRLSRRRVAAPSRAGRDLPAAIAVGLILFLAVLVGLLFLPLGFVILVTAFGVVGTWEVARALAVRDYFVPLVPVAAGAAVMPFAAYAGGTEALGLALAGTVLAATLWRCLDHTPGTVRSVLASAFLAVWVPFLLSFSMLLFTEPRGALKVATLLVLVVANDTFGYLVGAFLGKHPMAPKISPKKSWEGFAGSVGGATVVGILAAVLLLDSSWWVGLLLACATVGAATAGDLAESMVKRELQLKDMSNILPGHGGVMDRLDSIIFACPVAYLMSVTFLGAGA